jgi:hypothetical protein
MSLKLVPIVSEHEKEIGFNRTVRHSAEDVSTQLTSRHQLLEHISNTSQTAMKTENRSGAKIRLLLAPVKTDM